MILKTYWQALLSDFDLVEDYLKAKPFFNGEQFSLVDSSYAPVFQRLEFLAQIYKPIIDPERHPKLSKWKDNLLSLKAVKRFNCRGNSELILSTFVDKAGIYFTIFK